MSQVKLDDTEEKAEPVISEEKEVEHSIDESDLPLDQLPRGIAEMATSKLGVIRFECLPCKMFRMTPENVLTHCQSESHLKRLKDWDEKRAPKAQSERVKSAASKKPKETVDCYRLINPMNRKSWCLACHCTISSKQAWSNHAQNDEHLNKVALSDPESVPRLEWKVSCQGLAYVFCAQCLVNVRKVSDIEAHLKTSQHRKSLWSRPITDLLKKHVKSFDEWFQSDENDEDGLGCGICSKYVRKEFSYSKHIHSQRHLKALKAIFPVDEDPGFWCDICKTELMIQSKWEEHISSKSHLNKKLKQEKREEEKKAEGNIQNGGEKPDHYCYYCEIDCHNKMSLDDHIAGKKHRRKMDEYFRELEKNHVADEQSVEEKFEDGGEGAIPRENGMDLPVMEQPMNIEEESPNDELIAPIAFDPKAGMDGSEYLSRSPKMGKCRGQIRFRLECPVCSDSWCLACDRPISMDEQYWDIHTEFSDHKPNLEAAIKCCSPEGLRWEHGPNGEHSVECLLCVTQIPRLSDIVSHISDQTHRMNVCRANEFCREGLEGTDKSLCLLCDEQSADLDWQDHCNGAKHRCNLRERWQSFWTGKGGANLADLDSPMKPVVCAKSKRSKRISKVHCARWRLDLSEERSWCLACNCEASREMWTELGQSITHRSQLILLANVANPDGLLWESDHTGKNRVYCLVCSVQINELSAVQDHITIPDHWESVRRANEACKWVSSERGPFICLVCDKVIRSAKGWISHCKGVTHRRNLVTNLHRLGLRLEP